VKIAFVEVRDKTRLFEAIAGRLSRRHRISWLIQNHHYRSNSMSHATVLPYPTPKEIRNTATPDKDVLSDLEVVRSCDRFHVTFGSSTEHFAWYYERIHDWFERESPDLIIGEVGNFHSHMVSLIAERNGVLFVNPTSSRYPPGRFSFFIGDRFRPCGGDRSGLPDGAINQAFDDIVSGTRRPDYMGVKASRGGAIRYRAGTLAGWFGGERFATQSPIYFLREARKRAKLLARWDEVAVGTDAVRDRSRRPRILYPLQMQPELNLDVWAREYRQQPSLVRQLAEAGADVIVKPNPKSFHELDDEMVDAAASMENVVALRRDTPMTEVEPLVDLVVTASGTIAIERLLRGRPVAILLQDYANLLGVPSFGDTGMSLGSLGTLSACESIASAQAGVDGRGILRRLVETSYPGVIGEPRLLPSVLSQANVDTVVVAVEDLAARVLAGEALT
jgi:hypothetical protein